MNATQLAPALRAALPHGFSIIYTNINSGREAAQASQREAAGKRTPGAAATRETRQAVITVPCQPMGERP